MTLQDLGSIGEFVGGAVVVVSLIYLALQIRQNTSSLRAAAYQEAVHSANEWSSLLVLNVELNGLISKGVSDYSSLSAEELGQFSHLLSIALRNYAVSRHLASEGLIPESICETYEAGIRVVFESPKMLDWLADNELYLDSELREQIRKLVAA